MVSGEKELREEEDNRRKSGKGRDEECTEGGKEGNSSGEGKEGRRNLDVKYSTESELKKLLSEGFEAAIIGRDLPFSMFPGLFPAA